jgi:uncharacterized protein YkwD
VAWFVVGCLAIGCSADRVPPAPRRVATESESRLRSSIERARRSGLTCAGIPRLPARALRWDAELARSADVHAHELRTTGRLDHRGRDGSDAATRARRSGFAGRVVGEAIAERTADPEAVLLAWRASRPHCETLANLEANTIGIAFLSAEGKPRARPVWVAVLGAR